MAYSYDQISQFVSPQGSGGNNNVFGGVNAPIQAQAQGQQSTFGQPGGYSQSTGGAPNNTPVDENQKTSAAGEESVTTPSVGGNSAGNAASANSNLGSINPGAAAAAETANIGNTAQPSAATPTGQIQTDLNSANSGLAQAAADYVTAQAQNNTQSLSDQNIENAVTQGAGSNPYNQVANLLGQTASNVAPPAFQPGDLNIANISNLGTNAGIAQLLGQDNGPTYTPNISQFDTGLLGQDAAFQNQIANLQAQQAALTQLGQTTTNNVENQAGTAATNALTSAQQAAQNYLNTLQNNIVTGENTAATNATLTPEQQAAQLPGILAALNAAAQQQATTAINTQYGSNPTSAAQLAAAIAANPATAADVNWTTYNPSQFIMPENATQYNTISQLLNSGLTQNPFSGTLPAAYTTNPTSLADLIISAAQNGMQSATKPSTPPTVTPDNVPNPASAGTLAIRPGLGPMQVINSISNPLLAGAFPNILAPNLPGMISPIARNAQTLLGNTGPITGNPIQQTENVLGKLVNGVFNTGSTVGNALSNGLAGIGKALGL